MSRHGVGCVNWNPSLLSFHVTVDIIIDFNKSGVKGLPKEVLLQGKTPGSG